MYLRIFAPEEGSQRQQGGGNFPGSPIQSSATLWRPALCCIYNWLNETCPSIMIPGELPLWNPPATNRQLKADKGKYFRDLNAARHPIYPMEPAVQAVLQQSAEFDTKNLDIFACSKTLENLLQFIRGSDKCFRFIVSRVGNTIFLIRRENSPTELISDIRGYGHTFPEVYTTWGKSVAESESHQRIVTYKFGGLNFLVRFGSDGYIREKDIRTEPLKPDQSVDDLASILEGPPPRRISERFHIETGGRLVPQDNALASQVPTLVVAYHEYGVFNDIRIQDMKEPILQWERDNEGLLRKFVWLMNEITEYAKTSQTALEICYSVDGNLEVRRLPKEKFEALPAELQDRWITVGSGSEERTSDLGEREEDFNEEQSDNERLDDDSSSSKDYTACSAEDCGYCGHCTY
ncbi:hypothetical protein AJ80_01794 [Polytolypa hystricis UAMH7299]|uniref:Geranylgeranyl pyrophosphate synthetase n=1 Tax=Polytolypa hystricis (strain UAMH7299) TaxID=1447883 RepID=A0A2B7YZA5_POLH7|nr:hypothetical protein AJ80_01794 [Polytolypa hystricis UAMH7299]